jgi:hypothetical protein
MNLRRVIFLITVVCAVVGMTEPVAAQRAGPGDGKTPSKVQAKSVTITGCMTQGVDADHYVLANAVRREDLPSSAATAGSSQTVRSDKRGASDRTGPYDLQGGEFKAHLGQLVEVTGTGGGTDTRTGPAIESADERKPLPRFNVLSVKTLSPTCS